jgi:hypothetical protein
VNGHLPSRPDLDPPAQRLEPDRRIHPNELQGFGLADGTVVNCQL